MSPIKIVNYRPAYQPYFEAFNKAWIEKDFWLEELDKYVLTNPEEAILKNGGAILIGLYNDEVAGTVALKKVNDECFELTKMAVAENFRRLGIAEALCHAAIKKAGLLGAEKVILYSQTQLKPAILLYKKIGFIEVPLEPGTYQRANIKMEFVLKNSGNILLKEIMNQVN